MLERLRAARLHAQRSATDVDALVRGTIGLHSTDYMSPYLSAWARIPGFDPALLAGRLNTGAGLVRINAMRSTVHVVHADDLALISAATEPSVAARGRSAPGLKGLPDAAIDAGVEALCEALAAGPLGTNELKSALPGLGAEVRNWLMIAMGRGRVLRAEAPHARSNRTRYALAEQWVAGFRPGGRSPEEARRELILRAVQAFGPVTVDDVAWWLPAPKREVGAALASAGRALASVAEGGATWWFAAELADAAAPPREELGAWLLPYEDALLKGYVDRAWMLAPGLRSVIFPYNVDHWHPPEGVDPGPGPHGGSNVSGEARPSIWWAGRVVGRWEERSGEVLWQLHADVGAEGRDRVVDALGALERFLVERFRPLC